MCASWWIVRIIHDRSLNGNILLPICARADVIERRVFAGKGPFSRRIAGWRTLNPKSEIDHRPKITAIFTRLIISSIYSDICLEITYYLTIRVTSNFNMTDLRNLINVHEDVISRNKMSEDDRAIGATYRQRCKDYIQEDQSRHIKSPFREVCNSIYTCKTSHDPFQENWANNVYLHISNDLTFSIKG